MSMASRVRNEIPGGGWYLGCLPLGIGVVAVAGLAVTDLYPDDSDGPLFVGVVAGVALFAVVAVASAIGTRILTALAELASGQTPDEGSSSPS